MHWDGYTVFSIVSGVALMLAALSPRQKGSTRAWMLIGGIVILGYGIYVANQTSGTYYFPVWVFILPFLLAGRFLFASFGRSRTQNTPPGMPAGPQQGGMMPPPGMPQPGVMPPPPGDMMPPSGVMPPPPGS
jgi:hypothetical protein